MHYVKYEVSTVRVLKIHTFLNVKLCHLVDSVSSEDLNLQSPICITDNASLFKLTAADALVHIKTH
jgi:hypothetical protein